MNWGERAVKSVYFFLLTQKNGKNELIISLYYFSLQPFFPYLNYIGIPKSWSSDQILFQFLDRLNPCLWKKLGWSPNGLMLGLKNTRQLQKQ